MLANGAFMFGLGTMELLVLAVIVLVMFGGYKKLPSLGSSMAEGIKNFQKGLQGKDKPEITEKNDPNNQDKNNHQS